MLDTGGSFAPEGRRAGVICLLPDGAVRGTYSKCYKRAHLETMILPCCSIEDWAETWYYKNARSRRVPAA